MSDVVIGENIRFLRKRLGLTQGKLAEMLEVKRSLIGAYEEGRSDPRVDMAVKISRFFDITMQALMFVRLSEVPEEDLELKGLYMPGGHTLVVAVDEEGQEQVVLVPERASDQYARAGHADPEFLAQLPLYRLPFAGNEASLRAFMYVGDAMAPMPEGCALVCKYVEDERRINEGSVHMVVAPQMGILCHRVYKEGHSPYKLRLLSDNPAFAPYELERHEVAELWEVLYVHSLQMPDPPELPDADVDQLQHTVEVLEDTLENIMENSSPT